MSKHTTEPKNIFTALQDGDIEEVKRLLKAKKMAPKYFGDYATVPLVTVHDRYGGHATALMIAANFGHKDLAKFLIDNGANVNDKALDDFTALMVAADAGYQELAKLLIDNGADVYALNKEGENALMIAEKNLNNTIDLLKKHNEHLNEIANFVQGQANNPTKLESLTSEQKALLTDAKKFNRQNIQDVLAKKLITNTTGKMEAKQQAKNMIEKVIFGNSAETTLAPKSQTNEKNEQFKKAISNLPPQEQKAIAEASKKISIRTKIANTFKRLSRGFKTNFLRR